MMQVTIIKHVAWIACCCAVVAAGNSAPAAEQTFSLNSSRRDGDLDRIRVAVEVGGQLKLAEQDAQQHKPLKMSVVGEMRYDERLLEGQPQHVNRVRGIRYYDLAKAAIKIEGSATQPELRLSRALISVESEDGATTLFSPDGPLSRDEVDLVDIHGNTLLLETLLPGKPVAEGDSWPHSLAVVKGLLGLDSVRDANVRSTLEEVADGKVQIGLQGSVQGTAAGAVTTIGLKGRYQFDLKRSRITWLALLLKEDRDIGHVSPGLEATARVQVFVEPLLVGEHLRDEMVAAASATASPALTALSYQPEQGNFRFIYDRRWHIMTDEPNLMTMRLVADGELIAQCKVSTPTTPAAKRVLLSEFQDDIQTSLGDSFGQFTHATASANDRGQSIRRVVAVGQVDELPVQWNYYHVTDRDGNQVVFAFTFETSLAEQFADTDEAMLNSLEFFPSPKQASSRRKQSTQ